VNAPFNASIAVVLVEPAGPRNVGGVARACANFSGGPLQLQLRLVAPRCNHLGEEALQMAVHGRAVLEGAQLFANLPEALADRRFIVATSGRGEGEPLAPLDPDTALGWLWQGAIASSNGASGTNGSNSPGGACGTNGANSPGGATCGAVVFGREDRGLSYDELLLAGQLLSIDTGAAYSSLNLAQAAAVVLQRLRVVAMASADSPIRLPTEAMPMDPARRDRLEALLTAAEALLLEVGFLYPHTAHARMAKLRGLLQRSQIGETEVALLRGMVSQLRWASRHRNP
jgi:tRNA/rRNA methyltransferase